MLAEKEFELADSVNETRKAFPSEMPSFKENETPSLPSSAEKRTF